MKFFRLIPFYFAWHYTGAIKNILTVWGNYLWFTLNYFSLKTIFLSFFKPYKKLTEDNFYKTNESEFKLVTVVMVLVGIVLRLGVLVAGVFTLALHLFAGLIFFILWFALPILNIVLIMMGVVALIK
jgi:hypothetical protein